MNTTQLCESKKDLRKKFFRYTIPSVVAMWVFSIYTMVDGIFVSKGAGPVALTAVNLSMPYINAIFSISLLFATGASTIISIYLGKKEYENANKAFSLIISTIVILSVLILGLSLLNLDKIALFLGATENTLPMVKDYLNIIIIFNGFFIVSYCLEVLVKTDGFPHLATIGVVISAIANIVLDYIFVLEFGWGIKGAAFATGLSQILSAVFFIVHFLKSKSKLKFTMFKFDLSVIKRTILIGFPDSTTELSIGVVTLLFNQSILRFIGEHALVSYSIICYISTLVLMTMIGITQGMQPLSSYYYGKEEYTTIKKLLGMSMKSVLFASIVIFVVCIFFDEQIVLMFIDKSDMTLFDYSIGVFKVYALSFLILGYNVLIAGFCASIEKPFGATIISMSRGFVLVIVSLITMIAVFGGNGIWLTTVVSEVIVLLISFIILKKYLNHISELEGKESVEAIDA